MLQALFYAYWIMKAFYIFKSGSMQISDIILALAFVVFALSKRLKISHMDKKLILFLLFIFLINIINCIFNDFSNDFIRASMFYLYNVLLVILFRYLCEDLRFLDRLFDICRINLLIQVGIVFVGAGRWFANRYTGTFNDPNQMGFFIFSTFMIMNIIAQSSEKKRLMFIDYISSTVLIMLTASTGVFLGIASFILLSVMFMKNPRQKRKILCLIGISVIAFFFLSVNLDDISILSRVIFKFTKFSSHENSSASFDIMNILKDRNLTRIIYYPKYFIFGSGEGALQRFSKADAGELHSTILSIFFYYGILPLIALILWVRDNIKKMNQRYIPILGALLVESFVLLNQRQPFLWVIIILIYSSKNIYNISFINARYHTITTNIAKK